MNFPKNKQLMTIALIIVLAVSASAISTFKPTTAQTTTTITQPGTNTYGAVSQYEWPSDSQNSARTSFSAGPAPEQPNVIWKAPYGSGCVTTWKGKVFIPSYTASVSQPSPDTVSGGTLYALNAATGALLWSANMPFSTYIFDPVITVLNDNYIFAEGARSSAIFNENTGALVATINGTYSSLAPGADRYFPYLWISELNLLILRDDNANGTIQHIDAWDLSNPASPVLKWQTPYYEASEIMCYGNGVIMMGSEEWAAFGLNVNTGALMWRTPLKEQLDFVGTFVSSDNSFLTGGSGRFIYKLDSTTGTIKWQTDLGFFGFIAEGGSYGYGRYYVQYININGYNYAAFDGATGTQLWDYQVSLAASGGFVTIPYERPVVADNKVYVATPITTIGFHSGTFQMTALDAFTGGVIFQMPQQSATPVVAYGDLFLTYGGFTWCFGAPLDVTMWHNEGNTANPGATTNAGPRQLNLRWNFTTGAAVQGSPVVANGIVYVGSMDKNLYALNAYTGAKIWNFTTGYRILSTPAVVNGKVYTGADDGNVYALDANTGTQLWKQQLTTQVNQVFGPAGIQLRSSPIVMNNVVYVASVDGKVWALDANTGTPIWSYATGGPIAGTPAVGNNMVYILSNDMYMYGLNLANGNMVWRTITPVGLNQSVCLLVGLEASPIVANGMVYSGVNFDYKYSSGVYGNSAGVMAFNANTGAVVWRFEPNTLVVGSEAEVSTPTYLNGVVYMPNAEYLMAFNATTGLPLMANFLGHEVLSSPVVSDDPRGATLYIGTQLSVEYAYNITTDTRTRLTGTPADFIIPSNTGSTYDGGTINITTAAGLFNPMPFETGTFLNSSAIPLVGQTVPNGTKLAFFQSIAQIASSAAIYNGQIYVGSSDFNVYCFGDNVQIPTTLGIGLSSSKISSGQTVTVTGALQGNFGTSPSPLATQGATFGVGGIPNEPIVVSLRGPNNAAADLPATTDNNGVFSVTYTPTVAGNWQVVAHWNGYSFKTYSYASGIGSPQTLTVTSPDVATKASVVSSVAPVVAQAQMVNSNLTPSSTPSNSVATISLFVIAAAAIAVVIAIAAIVIRRRK